MRKTFNDPLFVSTPAGMVPTPMSENIIGRVREALQLLDASAHEGDVFDLAASERVFSLVECMFGKDQLRFLADQLQGAVMLKYNKRHVG